MNKTRKSQSAAGGPGGRDQGQYGRGPAGRRSPSHNANTRPGQSPSGGTGNKPGFVSSGSSSKQRDRSGSSGSRPSNNNNNLEDLLQQGIYKNKNISFAASLALGSNMIVETQGGKYFEGILTTWSKDFDIVLDQVQEVKGFPAKNDKMSNVLIDNCHIFEDKVVFTVKEIISAVCLDVDADSVVKDGFQTDAQISTGGKPNGDNVTMRELEKWEPDEEEAKMNSKSLDFMTREGENGWKAEDMFRRNEKQYGVQSTYKSNLEGYTMQLKEDDSEEYRRRQAKAANIAREIEGDTTSQNQIELENGDEEEAFSAVVRPGQNHGRGSKGMTPDQGDHDGSKYIPPARRQNSRGNSMVQSSHLQDRAPRYGHHDQRMPHHGGGQQRSTPPPHSHASGRRYQYRERETQQPQSGFSRDSGRGAPRDNRRSSAGGPQQHNERNHRQQPYERQASGGKHVPQVSASISSCDKPEQGVEHRGPPQQHNQSSRVSPNQEQQNNEQPGNRPPPHASKKESPSYNMQQRGNQSAPGRPGQKSRNEINAGFKNFQEKFNLKSDQSSQSQPQTVTPPVSQESTANQQQKAEIPEVSAAAATVDDPSSTSDKSNIVKNSKLNPNAKEFSFNPNTKPFVPGGRPSGTPPARPQTPGTPSMVVVSAPPTGYMPSFQVTALPGDFQVAANPIGFNARYAAAMRAGAQQALRYWSQSGPPLASGATELSHIAAVSGQPLMAPHAGVPSAASGGAPPSNFVQFPGTAPQPIPEMGPGLQNSIIVPTYMQQASIHQQQQVVGSEGGPASLPPMVPWPVQQPLPPQPGQAQQPPPQPGQAQQPPPPMTGAPPPQAGGPPPQAGASLPQAGAPLPQAGAPLPQAGGPPPSMAGGPPPPMAGGPPQGQPPPILTPPSAAQQQCHNQQLEYQFFVRY